MIDGMPDEPAPSLGPRLPSDNFGYIGLRIPGQQAQSYARSQKFSSTFSDPFA